jgi:hydrogenase expression/formation protein HypD
VKFIDEFRDKEIAQGLIRRIFEVSTRPVHLMEVCGTHTVSFFRHGIREMLPKHIRLLSGPGCPVCVTPNQDIDLAIALSRREDVLLATFGDMMRVPGSTSSLQKEKAEGRSIRIVYSPLEALPLAKENPEKKVVFLAVGFETTSPAIATTLLQAHDEGIRNLYFLNSQKRVPPALRALLESEKVQIHGFILPGHVCTILGKEPFEFLSKEFERPAVITGFEPLDLLQAVWMLVRQIENGQASVEIQYTRVVRDQGNPVAVSKMEQAFRQDDALWRGLGWIKDSGCSFRDPFSSMDARRIEVDVEPTREHPGCLCGEVLQAVRIPPECPLFRTVCNPDRPVGPCMVSVEGACYTYFKYEQNDQE